MLFRWTSDLNYIESGEPNQNAYIERFNARIAEVVAQTRFASAAELASTLTEYVKVYNCRIPQRNLGHVTPLDALKAWRAKAPDLFKKRPKDLPGLDNYVWCGVVVGKGRSGRFGLRETLVYDFSEFCGGSW